MSSFWRKEEPVNEIIRKNILEECKHKKEKPLFPRNRASNMRLTLQTNSMHIKIPEWKLHAEILIFKQTKQTQARGLNFIMEDADYSLTEAVQMEPVLRLNENREMGKYQSLARELVKKTKEKKIHSKKTCSLHSLQRSLTKWKPVKKIEEFSKNAGYMKTNTVYFISKDNHKLWWFFKG